MIKMINSFFARFSKKRILRIAHYINYNMDWFYNNLLLITGAILAPLVMCVIGNIVYQQPSCDSILNSEPPKSKKRYHCPRRKYRLKRRRKMIQNKNKNKNTSS